MRVATNGSANNVAFISAFDEPDREPDGVANSVTYGVANSVAYSVTFVSSANDRSFDLAVSVTVSGSGSLL